MSLSGFVLPTLSIGLGSLSLKPTRGFFPSSGSIDPLIAPVTLEESHRDELEITQHPVEQGAMISDHAYKRPAEVVIRCGWSNSPAGNPNGLIGAAVGAAATLLPAVGKVVGALNTLTAAQSLLKGEGASQIKATYKQLLELQASRIPFNIYTGKRIYKNMLFASLSTMTDVANANILLITAVCREVLIVQTQTVQTSINTDAQAQPEKTTPTVDAGPKQLQPAPNYQGAQ